MDERNMTYQWDVNGMIMGFSAVIGGTPRKIHSKSVFIFSPRVARS